MYTFEEIVKKGIRYYKVTDGDFVCDNIECNAFHNRVLEPVRQAIITKILDTRRLMIGKW